MSDLHGQIMNIQVESKRLRCCIDDVMFAYKPDIESMITLAYKIGHRDARHAAAEMSISVQAQRDELLAAAKSVLSMSPSTHIDSATCFALTKNILRAAIAHAEAAPCD